MPELTLPAFDASDPSLGLADAPDTPETPADTPAAPAADPAPTPEVASDPLYEVKVGGKTFKVPLSELTAGYQRQSDYSRKTMALAERQREIERIQQEHQRYTTEREQLKQFLSDPVAVQAYLEQINGARPNDQPITAGQLQQLIARQAQMQQQAMEQRMSQMTADFEIRQTAAQYATEIDTTISHALNQFPELKNVRRIERILREEVAERSPSNLEEAKALFLQVAKEQAEALRNFAVEEKKKSAVQSAQLRNGIEPPGGTGVQPAPQKLALGSQALRDAFEASLREGS